MGKPKQAGLCSLCDEPCFQIREVYPAGHLLEGRVRKIGPPLAGARRDTFELSGGTQVDLTFCSNCNAAPDDLPGIWQRCVDTSKEHDTPEVRAVVGASVLSVKEQKIYDAHNDGLAMQSISGPVSTRLWTEVR